MTKRSTIFNLSTLFAALMIVTLLGTTPVRATSLGLTLNDYPDFFSSASVSYVKDTSSFSAIGTALSLHYSDTETATISNGIFSVNAIINNSGIFDSGSLTINGTVDTLGYSSGTLLEGDLTTFGYAGSDDSLEFLFDVTGGDAMGLFGGQDALGGIIMSSLFTDFTGSFASDWTATSLADTAPVPEPATLTLLGLGIMSFAGLKRKKRS